jgi:hypothetical protein
MSVIFQKRPELGVTTRLACSTLIQLGVEDRKNWKVRLTVSTLTFTISPEFCLFSVPAPLFEDASLLTVGFFLSDPLSALLRLSA